MVVELRNKILVAGGAVAVAVGAYLPWLRINPNLPPDAEVPTINYTGMGAGFEGFDFVLLGAVGLVLLLHSSSFWTPIRIVTGVGVAVFPVYYLSYSTLFRFSATFVPALGWYLTVLGGTLLSHGGGRQLPSLIHRLKATATLRE
ncbi:hypothetical protein M0R88_10345 [Halorussus gelatinilyticus]|uniref:Uncharacterized protein n=1 Tax=Halorussus gelatinilyticus TaxID=2937524 RepID=A0A8U0IE01_9EURY|nr:hypothetical protein [Halorussus gelatinilyticus]UPV98930.1 hypothetical protein M0R88_10345 [Halorussus gelatinilyticus]